MGRSDKEDYRSRFSEALAQRVADTWRREIDLYGFDFESVENASEREIALYPFLEPPAELEALLDGVERALRP